MSGPAAAAALPGSFCREAQHEEEAAARQPLSSRRISCYRAHDLRGVYDVPAAAQFQGEASNSSALDGRMMYRQLAHPHCH
jgi:hypothetical protein